MTKQPSLQAEPASTTSPNEVLNYLKHLATSVKVNITGMTSDVEISRVAFAWIQAQAEITRELLYYCQDEEEFLIWDLDTLQWKKGKNIGEMRLLDKFVQYLRNTYKLWEETYRADGQSKEEATFEPAKTYFGQMAKRYLSLSGLSTLRDAFKIPIEHQLTWADFNGEETDELFPINSDNGKVLVVDTRTGSIRPAQKEDKLTIKSSFRVKSDGANVTKYLNDPSEDWLKDTVFYQVLTYLYSGSEEWIRLHQRLFGSFLVAGNKDQIFAILYGKTRSGKGVLMDSFIELMGPLARVLNPKVFLNKSTEQASDGYELGHIEGLRLLVISETAKGDVLNDGLIKNITGNKYISTRKINKDIKIVRRTFTLAHDTNHIPADKDSSGGLSTRLVYLMCSGKTLDRASRNPEFLRRIIEEESEKMLAWYLLGAQEFLKKGIQLFDSADGSNPENQLRMSVLHDFIEEEILHGEAVKEESFVPGNCLKYVYSEYCKSGQVRFAKSYANVVSDLERLTHAVEGKKKMHKLGGGSVDVRGFYNIGLKTYDEGELYALWSRLTTK